MISEKGTLPASLELHSSKIQNPETSNKFSSTSVNQQHSYSVPCTDVDTLLDADNQTDSNTLPPLPADPKEFEPEVGDMGKTNDPDMTSSETAVIEYDLYNSDEQNRKLKSATQTYPSVGQQDSLILATHLETIPESSDESLQGDIGETESNSAHICTSQESQLPADQECQYTEDLEKQLITHDNNSFQEFLIKKGLNHQTKRRWVGKCDLELCLSMYTKLEVLDENNKFICKSCTAQKQCT